MRLSEILHSLRIWSTEVELRAEELKRCNKIWTLIHYLLRGPVLLFSALATLIMTLGATQSSIKGSFTPLAIAAIVINSISIFLNSVDTALEAGKKATLCSLCAREYIELSSQMTLDIDTLSLEMRKIGDNETGDIDDSIDEQSYDIKDLLHNYKFIKARYMTKEQSIANTEPSNIFFRKNYVNKQLLAVHPGVNHDDLDNKSIVSLRNRTRRASKWRLNKTTEHDTPPV